MFFCTIHHSSFTIHHYQMRLEKVKTLISDDKIQQAIDLLQDILKDKNNELLNQTLLLEGQYKDLKKKMQLGLQDASADLNRINLTLLSVCDDAAQLENIGDDGPEKPFTDVEKTKGVLNNSVAIFGGLAAIAVAIVVGLYFVFSNNAPARKSVETAPLALPTPTAVTPSVKEADLTWLANPSSTTISERYYGNVKVDILSITSKPNDAETKILTLNLRLNCLKSSSGTCLASYLEFRLIQSNGDKDAPKDDIFFANNPKDGTSVTNKVSFVVAKSLKQADFQIYYRDKLERTLVTVKLNTL